MVRLTFLGLLPVLIAAVYLYRGKALVLLLVSVITAVAAEAIVTLILHKPLKILDGHAALIGTILALLMPAGAAWWVVAVAAALAIVLGKMVFGNAWNYPFHPALVALVLVQLSWSAQMDVHYKPLPMLGAEVEDGQSRWEPAVEPLAATKVLPKLAERADTMELLWGDHPGAIGTTSVVAIAIGGLLLILMGVVPWQIPVGFIGGAWVFAAIMVKVDPGAYPPPAFSLFAGGLFFAAVFLATEWVTSPVTPWGRILFGVGAGVLTLIIRYWGNAVDGAFYAVLIMNAVTPLLDRLAPIPFGRRLKAHA
jgi:electron transport complex protein RnfD